MDATTQTLIQVFGPSGVLLGLGITMLKTIVPWLREYLVSQSAAIARIADAIEHMEQWEHGVNLRLDRIERLADGISRDMTGLYARSKLEQPSEQRRRDNAAARGRNKPAEDQL